MSWCPWQHGCELLETSLLFILATFCCRVDFGTVLIELSRTLLQQEPSAAAEGSSQSLRHWWDEWFWIPCSVSQSHKGFPGLCFLPRVFKRSARLESISFSFGTDGILAGGVLKAPMLVNKWCFNVNRYRLFLLCGKCCRLITFIMNSERDQEIVFICKQC